MFIYLGGLSFFHGLFFITLLVGYCWYLFNKGDGSIEQHGDSNYSKLFPIVIKILLGIFGLGFGAHFFVEGARGIALALGVSSLVIGM